MISLKTLTNPGKKEKARIAAIITTKVPMRDSRSLKAEYLAQRRKGRKRKQ
jgi:hypothetical protein